MKKIFSVTLILLSLSATLAFAGEKLGDVCYAVNSWQASGQTGNQYTYDPDDDRLSFKNCRDTRDAISMLSNKGHAFEAECVLQEYPAGETNCAGKIYFRVYLVRTKLETIVPSAPKTPKTPPTDSKGT